MFTLKEGRYELHCAAEVQGKLTSLNVSGREFNPHILIFPNDLVEILTRKIGIMKMRFDPVKVV